MGEEPEEKRKAQAEDKARNDGKVEGSVFAAMDDVAGKAAELQRKLSAEVEKGAD